MGRVFTSGAEVQAVNAGAEQVGFSSVGAPTINTASQRSGRACWSCAGTGGVANTVKWAGSFVVSADYYARGYFNLSSLPTARNALIEVDAAGGKIMTVNVETDGTITVVDNGTVAHTSTLAVVANRWFRLELRFNVGTTTSNGTIEARLNGVVVWSAVGTANAGTAAPTAVQWGQVQAVNNGITAVLVDDLAINDTALTTQNSWPGEGKVVLLLPVSDNARTGWVAGTATTTNLWDAVNNTPPVGVKDTAATATSQIQDTVANTTDTYVANLGAYTASVASGGGGMGVDDTITVVNSLVVSGTNSTISIQVGQSVTNPTIAESLTNASAASNVDIYPTNWATARGTLTYGPNPALATQPTMTVRKATSTAAPQVCLIGMHVEYVPNRAPNVTRRRPVRQAVQRRVPSRGRFMVALPKPKLWTPRRPVEVMV